MSDENLFLIYSIYILVIYYIIHNILSSNSKRWYIYGIINVKRTWTTENRGYTEGRWWWGRHNGFQQRWELVLLLSGQRREEALSVQRGAGRTRVAKCRSLEMNQRPQWEGPSPFCLHVQLARPLEYFMLWTSHSGDKIAFCAPA